MDPAKKKALENIGKKLEEIAKHKPQQLSKGKDLGAINFLQGQPLFEQTIEMAKELQALPLDLLPVATVQGFVGHLENLRSTLEQISKFTLVGQANPENQRNSLVTTMGQQYDQAFTIIAPWLSYLSLKSAEVQETMRRSKELLEKTKQQTQASLQDIEKKGKEVDEIVRAAREAAGKIGVAHFAVNFEEIAKKHGKASMKWLIGAIAVAILTIITAVAFLFLLPPLGELNAPDTIQRIVTKLVIVSILYYSAIWASKNYKAHRHLQVVNEHRQNALNTFETFVKAAGPDDSTKNAVLLEATHCIFAPAVSGYLDGESEEIPASRVIEILRSNAVGPGK